METVLVRQVATGSNYYISKEKYQKELSSWELVAEAKAITKEPLSYADLKKRLEELDIVFKKNAKRETLEKLLDKVIG